MKTKEIILNKDEKKRITRERKYLKYGFIIRDEYWRTYFEDKPEGHAFLIEKRAYNLNGDWIGDSKFAFFLARRGIKPEKACRNDNICTIGFCEREQKWYGWSHRAICGFGIGDKLFKEKFKLRKKHPKYKEYLNKFNACKYCDTIEDIVPFREHGKKTIKKLKAAKRAAINFAKYIS